MNIYVIIEGETAARKLYKNWIPLVNESLQYVDYLTDVKQNNFFILAGFGQPYIWQRLECAVKDVNEHEVFDRLVIAIDSEDCDPRDQQLEASARVDRMGCRVEVRYVIQHFCLETWLLGNKYMFRKNSSDVELKEYMELFNIRHDDPALLPPYTRRGWNRSQFAYHFLRAGIRDVYTGRGLLYSKKHPGPTLKKDYFSQVRSRCFDERHILSFESFLNAFV